MANDEDLMLDPSGSAVSSVDGGPPLDASPQDIRGPVIDRATGETMFPDFAPSATPESIAFANAVGGMSPSSINMSEKYSLPMRFDPTGETDKIYGRAKRQSVSSERYGMAAIDALEKQSAIDAEHARMKAEKVAEYNDARAQILQRKQSALENKKNLISNLIDEAAAAKVNPDRIWMNPDGSPNTAKSMKFAIASIVGGIGAALSGQRNLIPQIIENAVSRDIAAQRFNIQQKFKKADYEKSLLGLIDATFDTDLERNEAAKLTALGQLDKELSIKMTEAKNPQIQSNINNARASLQARMSAISGNLANLSNSIEGRKQVQYERELAARRKLAERSNKYPIPGFEGSALTEKAYGESMKMAAGLKRAEKAFDKLIGLREKYGSTTMPWTKQRAVMEPWHFALLIAAKGLYNESRLSDLDMKMLFRLVGESPGDYGHMTERYKQAREVVRSAIGTNLEMAGYNKPGLTDKESYLDGVSQFLSENGSAPGGDAAFEAARKEKESFMKKAPE